MTATQLHFRVLGLVEVRLGDRPLPIAQPKRRALLALLVLRRNTVVAVTEIVDALWDDDPPRNVRNQVQVYVCGLRRLLGAAGPELLTTRSAGYLLDPGASRVDLADVDAAVDSARLRAAAGDLAGADRHLRSALDLWRGPALDDLRGAYFSRAATHLEQRRLAVLEEWMWVQLALGRDGDLVLRLPELLARHPLHEGLRYGLMLALYRSGRPAQALGVYADGRRHTVEELGIEPGSALRSLHRSILRGDPPPAGPPGAPVPTGPATPTAPRHPLATATRYRLRRTAVRRAVPAPTGRPPAERLPG